MNKLIKQLGLTRVANSYVSRLEQAQKLKEIANRKNYPHKVKVLYDKISEQYDFWNQKQNSAVLVNSKEKLEDLDRDLIFIESQINVLEFKKERIDLLMTKYGCN